MQTTSTYQSHISITKELNMNEGFVKVREPYKDDFEKLRTQAKDEKVNISNAKEFLNSLSKEELNTLQHYSGLAEEIKVGKLNDEGAYNLLLDHYEKYDFDNDGFVMDGVAKTIPVIPKNMPDTDKKAFVNALNQMDDKDAFNVMMLTSLPTSFKFENGEFIPVMNEQKNYSSVMERVNRIINPLPGEYTSDEIKNSFMKFKELFEKSFEEQKKLESTYANNSNEINIMKAKLENIK